MPTYEFRCPSGHEFDRFFKTMSSAPTELPCPECGLVASRQLSGGGGLVFKGSGFYLTDYGKNAHRGQKSEGQKAEGGKQDGGKSEGGKGEAAKPEGGKAESGRTEGSKSESAKPQADSGKKAEAGKPKSESAKPKKE